MAARIQTARGVYLLTASGEPEHSDSAAIITLSLERTDGIERVAFRCAIRDSAPKREISLEAFLETIARWIEPQFEQLREAALKSIRAERKLLEVEFEADERR